MRKLFKDPIRDMLLVGLITATMVLSGIFDVNTLKALTAVIIGSIVISSGVVIWIEGRMQNEP